MGNITETSTWEANVTRIEENDLVLGGEDGPLNAGVKKLANRTLWLKDHLAPIGSIVPFAGSIIPDNWLECDGSELTISSYQSLYDTLKLYHAWYVDSINLVSNYIHLVDLAGAGVVTATATAIHLWSNGELPRDGDDLPLEQGATYYVRSIESGNYKLYHSAADANADTNAIDITTNGTGVIYSYKATKFLLPDLRGVFVRGLDNLRGLDTDRRIASYQDDAFEAHTHVVNLRSNLESGGEYPPNDGESAGSQTNYNSNSTGGTETRPKNIALYHIIKFE